MGTITLHVENPIESLNQKNWPETDQTTFLSGTRGKRDSIAFLGLF